MRNAVVLHATKRIPWQRRIHSSTKHSSILEPRLEGHGKVIRDEYSVIRADYGSFPVPMPHTARCSPFVHIAAPKHPVVLAHGLLGFDELRLAGPYLPGVQYWRGIKEALSARGIEVITATVPPSASIEARAEELARIIESDAHGKDVNVIA